MNFRIADTTLNSDTSRPFPKPKSGRIVGLEGWRVRPAYLAWSTIHCTAFFTCSSVKAGLPPLGGMKLPSGPW